MGGRRGGFELNRNSDGKQEGVGGYGFSWKRKKTKKKRKKQGGVVVAWYV